MDNNTPTRPICNNVRIFKIFTAVSGIVTALIGGILFALFFDSDSMYFKHNFPIHIIGALIFATVITAAVLCVVLKQEFTVQERRSKSMIEWFSALELLTLCISFFFSFIAVPISSSDIFEPKQLFIEMLKGVMILAVTVCTVLYASGLFRRSTAANVFFGICSVVFCIIVIAITYLDYSTPINSPYEIICQFGVAFGMLMIVSELRIYLGGGKQGRYKFLSCMTFCINLLASTACIFIDSADTSGASYEIYIIPAVFFSLYSLRFFFIRAQKTSDTDTETPDTHAVEGSEQENNPDERTDTDEILN